MFVVILLLVVIAVTGKQYRVVFQEIKRIMHFLGNQGEKSCDYIHGYAERHLIKKKKERKALDRILYLFLIKS